MKIIAFCLLVLFLPYACNNVNVAGEKTAKIKKAKTDFDINAVKSLIAEANKVYGERFKRNEAELYAERYCEDALIFPSENPAISGRDAIRNYYYDNGKNKDLSIVIQATKVYGSPDMVVEEGTYDFPDGRGGSFDQGKFIALWKMEAGKWKLFREIWNTNISPKKIG
jgi:ketosteroid isomerase-like protein